MNLGIFLDIIIDIISNYKKNGKGKEYYKNGDIKYEGNYEDDKYNGDGKLTEENGEIYIGEFKNGKNMEMV